VDGLYCCRRQIDVFFGQISQSLQLCDFLWQFSIPRAILPCCGKTPNLFYRRSESDSIFEKRREYMNHHFQLIVIGSGSGGKDAAVLGARTGLRVLLVEKDNLGGTCFHRGCYSIRTLRACALLIWQWFIRAPQRRLCAVCRAVSIDPRYEGWLAIEPGF
jgi:hypothetical protein